MSADNKRNDKFFDILLEEAFDKYSDNDDIVSSLTEEELEFINSRKQPVYKKISKNILSSRQKTHIKKTVLLVAAMIVVISAAINVTAFRSFVYKYYMDMKGTVLNISTGRISASYDEITAFERKDDIVIPNWLPPGMVLTDVIDTSTYLQLYYESDEHHLFIEHSVPGNSNMGMETKNNEVDIKECKILGIDGTIIYSRSELGFESRKVFWLTNTCQYSIVTNAPKEMFNAIFSEIDYKNK